MKKNRFVTPLVVLALVLLTVASSLTVKASSDPEYIWPTTEIAANPNSLGYATWISPDGNHIALRTGDYTSNNPPQAWLVNRLTGESEFLANEPQNAQFSDNTRYHLYTHTMTPGPSYANYEATFLKDRQTGEEVQIDYALPSMGNQYGNPGTVGINPQHRSLSKDGSFAIFIAAHYETMFPEVPANTYHLYGYERDTQTRTLIDDPLQGEIATAVMSGDGRYVYYIQGSFLSNNSIYKYDRQTSERQLVFSGSRCNEISTNGDGSVLAYTCAHGVYQVINFATGEERTVGVVTNMSDDGKTMILGRYVYLWDQRATLPLSKDTQIQETIEGNILISGNSLKTTGSLRRAANPPLVPYTTYAPVVFDTPLDSTPPIIQPHRSPVPNASGWNNTDVTITWDVSDPESSITDQAGCDATSINIDMPETTYTCTATSDGGTASQSITVKRDGTRPTAGSPTMSGGTDLTLLGLGYVFTAGSTNITTSVGDNLSGVVAAEYYFDTNPATSLTLSGSIATATANLSVLTSGQHTLNVRCLDAAGNWSTVSTVNFVKL